MRSQKFSFTLNKGNKFGTLATDLLKAKFLFLFLFLSTFFKCSYFWPFFIEDID